MIKLTKEEVSAACEAWLRGTGHQGYKERSTTDKRPLAIDLRQDVKCKHTRSGAECRITEKPPTKGSS